MVEPVPLSTAVHPSIESLFLLVKPQFKACFQVEVVPPKEVFLLSEQGNFVLRGRLYVLLAPFLNGEYQVEEIADRLQGKATLADVQYALSLLLQKGYITLDEAVCLPQFNAFWHLQNLAPQQVSQRLRSAQVQITDLGTQTAAAMTTALESLQIGVGSEYSLEVVLTQNYLHPGLKQINQQALIHQRPWVLLKPVGSVLWIGPFFRPGGACWQCLAHRLQANFQVEAALQARQLAPDNFSIAKAHLPSTIQTGLNLAATQIARWLAQPDFSTSEEFSSYLYTFDLLRLELQKHPVVRRPQCPCCGESRRVAHRTAKQLILQSRPKHPDAEDGYRVSAPELMFQQYQHQIDPITGIVRSLIQPALPGMVHAYVAEQNLGTVTQTAPQKSFGKGITDAQARMSALGEAIERYSSLFQGDELRISAPLAALGDAAVHPYACFHYSDRQYRDRRQWNADHEFIHWVPVPFDETQPIDWTPVWSLTNQQFKFVPTAYCYANYPLPPEHDFCAADTNGCAAGATLEEAILQGFLELVERDAVALWWYNRVQLPQVAIESFANPYLQTLQQQYAEQHREFWVLDLTSDLQIPTFAAISRRTDRQPEDILFGFGSHLDPALALLRAVTEMNQMIFLSTAANPQGRAQFSRQAIQTWCDTATVENQPYLLPNPHQPGKKLSDYGSYASEDLQQDVLHCLKLAEAQGLELLVLDQTQPDIGLTVVKVMMPGLRHFWAQFAPGRLYDVPLKLGWLSEPCSEDQLNPIPMFL